MTRAWGYDRTPGLAIESELAPGRSLSWLVDWARQTKSAHLQFRRAAGAHKHGCLQVYLGRTSLLAIVARADGSFRLEAHAKYSEAEAGLPNDLFTRPMSAAMLENRRAEIEAHLTQARERVGPSFREGEAIVHAGLLRRYGPDGGADDPFTALDSEVTLAFPSREAREQFHARAAAAYGREVTVHRELDVLGVLKDGRIALVEIKKKGGDIEEAVQQVATHLCAFDTLAKEVPTWTEALRALATAKAKCRLLPRVPPIATAPTLVGVVAAPDGDRQMLVRATAAAKKAGVAGCEIVLWRLADSDQPPAIPPGEIEEELKL